MLHTFPELRELRTRNNNIAEITYQQNVQAWAAMTTLTTMSSAGIRAIGVFQRKCTASEIIEMLQNFCM